MSCGCGCNACGQMPPELTSAMLGDPHALKTLGAIGAPGDILPTVVWPSDVTAQKRRIDPAMATTDAAVKTCTALTDADRAAWSRFYASWRSFYDESVPWIGAANKYDEALAYEGQLSGWQDQLRGKCTIPGPPPPKPSDNAPDYSVVKWAAAAAIVVAAVYGIKTVWPR